MAAVIVIVKIGTSSLTDDEGHIRADVIAKLCDEVAAVRSEGHQVILVSSGAITAGLPALGFDGASRPRDARTLQAASAVGQSRLMAVYEQALAKHGLAAGIFTKDSGRSLRVAKAVKAGIVWVNTYRAVSPIAQAGGMKYSGYGRESGFQAVYDYTRPKTVWMNTSDEPLGSQFVAR